MSIVSVLPYSPSYVHSGVFDCSVMETWTTNDKEDKREARKEPQDDLNAAGTAVTRRTVRNELQSSPFLHLALFKRYPLIGGNGNKTKKKQPLAIIQPVAFGERRFWAKNWAAAVKRGGGSITIWGCFSVNGHYWDITRHRRTRE